MAQIELKDHGMVDIDTQLTAATFLTLQDEGIVDKDFLDKIVNAKVEGDIPLNIKINTLYAAYREANETDYLDYQTFTKSYQIDYVQLTLVVGAAIVKKDVGEFGAFSQTLINKIPKTGTSSGK